MCTRMIWRRAIGCVIRHKEEYHAGAVYSDNFVRGDLMSFFFLIKTQFTVRNDFSVWFCVTQSRSREIARVSDLTEGKKRKEWGGGEICHVRVLRESNIPRSSYPLRAGFLPRRTKTRRTTNLQKFEEISSLVFGGQRKDKLLVNFTVENESKRGKIAEYKTHLAMRKVRACSCSIFNFIIHNLVVDSWPRKNLADMKGAIK